MSGYEDDDTVDCSQRDQAGAYALHALQASEAERYARHLDECPICREELARLAQAVDLLPAIAPQVVAPDGLQERIMAQVRQQEQLFAAAEPQPQRRARPGWMRMRRSPRPMAALVASVALLVGLVVGGVFLGSGSTGSGRISANVAVSAAGAHAELRRAGTQAELVVAGLPQPPVDHIYEVWLERAGGSPQPTDALFGVTHDGQGSVDVPSDLAGVRRVMVTAEPLGGSRHPTSQPIIVATLSA